MGIGSGNEIKRHGSKIVHHPFTHGSSLFTKEISDIVLHGNVDGLQESQETDQHDYHRNQHFDEGKTCAI